MAQSMTAFAREQKQLDAGMCCWEIRSVNHRYLDLSFRLPEAFRFLEPSLRQLIRGKLQRGKVECQFKFQGFVGNQATLLLNESLVDELLQLSERLADQKQLANNLSLKDILAWPGVIQTTEQSLDSCSETIELLFSQTLEQLKKIREVEGIALVEAVQSRLDKLNSAIEQAKLNLPTLSSAKEKLMARLDTFELAVDKERIEQEIALLLTRLDVSEELDRLQLHAIEVKKALYNPDPAGRRLDFLMQELNREANTLSAKSDSHALTQIAVDMKVLIEQMREQIQNIE